MALDLTVYNYLVPEHHKRPMTKYDTHDGSELKDVVKDIMKMNNSTSPTWLVKLSDDKQTYALNIKEESIALFASLSALSDTGKDALFSQRKAYTNLRNLSAKIVTSDLDKLPDEFDMKVESLAKQQINHGNSYFPTGKGLPAGTYRFNMSINDDVYEFQFNIRKDAKHIDVMNELAAFINKAGVGIVASVSHDEGKKVSMVLESRTSGIGTHGNVFSLQDLATAKGIVTYYNLNQVVQAPSNAHFTINGEPKESQSNSFILNQALQITLHDISSNEVHIAYRPDSDKIIGGIREMISDYNGFIDYTNAYIQRKGHIPKLNNELAGVVRPYRMNLESCGIHFDYEGHMDLDESLAVQACFEGDMKELFSKESPFLNHLLHKTNEIKLNPMEYVEKILVTYPDTESPGITRSYITSLYSGMLFNYYC